jgi:hypothetical protein
MPSINNTPALYEISNKKEMKKNNTTKAAAACSF